MWRKVSQLKTGQEIAVFNDKNSPRFGEAGKSIWDEIKTMRKMKSEDVYDIEVEGTHNFIGNDIVAHNTAFLVDSDGNVGIGTSTPDYKLSVVGGMFASTTSNQLTLAYDLADSDYATFSINEDGDLNIDLATGNSTTTFSDNLSVLGYLNVEGSATTTGSHYIRGTASTTQLFVQGTGHIGGIFSVDGASTFLSDITQTGNLSITGYASTTAGLFTLGEIRTASNLTSDGNLLINGNATTTGSHYIGKDLTVDGQCVTGDSLLPIVILSQQTKDLNEIDSSVIPQNDNIQYTRIDQVKPGDYVMSLNEKTDQLEPARIKGLLDMGVKPIYQIETENGKTIRTTGNHPYLAKQDELSASDPNFSPADNSQLAVQITSFIDYSNKTQNDIDNFMPFHLTDQNNHNSITFGNIETENIAKSSVKCQQDSFILGSKFKHIFVVSPSESCLADSQNIKTLLTQSHNNIFVNTFISKEFKHNYLSRFNFQNFFFTQNASGVTQGSLGFRNSDIGILLGDIRQSVSASEKMQNIGNSDSGTHNTGFAKSDFLLDNNTGRGSSFDSFIHSTDDYIKTEDNLSSEAQWTKVIYLSEGDQIAVADKDLESIKFTKIKKITQLPPEQVYDIEVEGTHNFVANGIIAHNTYINGNLDMSNNLILNIGNAGTDFTSTGGLTLAGDFQVNANATTTGSLNVDGDFLTDGTGSFASANLTIDSSGNLLTTGYASTTTYLNTQGNSHIGGIFSVDGASTFLSDITQTGNLSITGYASTTAGLFTLGEIRAAGI